MKKIKWFFLIALSITCLVILLKYNKVMAAAFAGFLTLFASGAGKVQKLKKEAKEEHEISIKSDKHTIDFRDRLRKRSARRRVRR